MSEEQKQFKATNLGRAIDKMFGWRCEKLGLDVTKAINAPLLSLEIAGLELLQNDYPQKTRPQKQHNGNGAG
jgi:hypothetical protein